MAATRLVVVALEKVVERIAHGALTAVRLLTTTTMKNTITTHDQRRDLSNRGNVTRQGTLQLCSRVVVVSFGFQDRAQSHTHIFNVES
jgi:hypothetical protein